MENIKMENIEYLNVSGLYSRMIQYSQDELSAHTFAATILEEDEANLQTLGRAFRALPGGEPYGDMLLNIDLGSDTECNTFMAMIINLVNTNKELFEILFDTYERVIPYVEYEE